MRIPYDIIPDEIKTQYNLKDLIHNGYVYTQIDGGMYGLPQAGRLAYEDLRELLNKNEFYESVRTPGYWRHENKPISFVLIGDDFGVKVQNDEDALHLIRVLQSKYEIEVD